MPTTSLFTERLFALVLLPAAPGFDGDAEKGRRTVGALGEVDRAPGFEFEQVIDALFAVA